MEIDFAERLIRRSTSPRCTDRPISCISGGKHLREEVDRIYNRAACLSRSLRIFSFEVSVLTGKEKYSGHPLTVLFIGEGSKDVPRFGKFYSRKEIIEKNANYRFITDTVYSDFSTRERDRASAFNLRQLARRYENRVDMIFVDAELLCAHLFASPPFIAIPQWIPLKLEIPGSWAELVAAFPRNLRRELKRVLRCGYQYVVSDSEAHFQKFYSEMYLPYITRRFGNLSVPNTHRSIMSGLAGSSDVLFLLHDGKIVLGVLQKYVRNRMISVCAAAADQLTPLDIKGAFTAMDYFSILNAFERGCEEIDFLGSRPLLENGPFRYKRKWGASVERFPLPLSDFFLRVCNLGPGARSFLAHNPLVASRQGKLAGRVFLVEKATAEIVERCRRRYFTKGLDHVAVYCSAGVSAEALEYARAHAPLIRIVDLDGDPHPVRTVNGWQEL